MKKYLITIQFVLIIAILLVSCADNKTLEINGKNQVIEPYGWFDLEAENQCVKYKVVTGNVVWSVLLMETVFAPILITGNSLFEPVSVKEHCKQNLKGESNV
jgi:hypothetical protein